MNFVEKLFLASRWKIIGRVFYLILKILGLEIPVTVKVGKFLKLPHWACGLVVHPNSIIGDNVCLYQGVTIGRADIHKNTSAGRGYVELGDGVIVGAGAKILFRRDQHLQIGRGAMIGANSVIVCNVGENEIWAGVPARMIGNRS